MPAKKHFRQLPAEQQVAGLQTRATRLACVQKVKFVNSTLKARPDLADACDNLLRTLLANGNGGVRQQTSGRARGIEALALKHDAEHDDAGSAAASGVVTGEASRRSARWPSRVGTSTWCSRTATHQAGMVEHILRGQWAFVSDGSDPMEDRAEVSEAGPPCNTNLGRGSGA